VGLYLDHLVDDGLSILQHADNTIILMNHDLEYAKNMKLVLTVFEQLFGLKIKFHKNEILPHSVLLLLEARWNISLLPHLVAWGM
jgi:hypothetical protein